MSVVIPVHNVESYLADCLDSVLSQSYADMEVVIVDDGGSDGSVALAERYVLTDPRVRLVEQANAGLGAARNVGVVWARGAYLTFVDSDDLVPPGAYETMMSTIEETGSDMVVGCLRQLVGRRTRMGPLMRENHARRRERVALSDMPLMLADVFAVNKIYRRSFWDAAGLGFPTGIRYEDQPTLTRAFIAARSFDVLPETVYLWRRRRDRSSITQSRHQLVDLYDRVVSKRLSTQAVVAADPGLAPLWYSKILPVDMWEYFRAAVTGSEEYWQTLRAATAEFWNEETVPFVETNVPAQQRLMGWLVLQDRRSELADVIRFVNSCSGNVPVEIRGQQVICPLPGVDDPRLDLPPATYTLAPHELAWDARLLSFQWSGSVLLLHGFALIRNLSTRGRQTSLQANALGPGGVNVPLVVEAASEPLATEHVGRPGQDYDECGFDTQIDVERLAKECPVKPGQTVRWHLSLERSVATVRRAGELTGDGAGALSSGWHHVSSDLRARLVSSDTVILELAEA